MSNTQFSQTADYDYSRCERCGYEHNVDDPYTCPNYDDE